MRQALIAVVVLVALAMASTALAAYQYAPPRQWSPGAGAGSYFSSGWLANYFMTYGSGTDKTVTFINANGYGWHNTRRGGSDVPRDVRAVARNVQGPLRIAQLLLGELQCPLSTGTEV